MRVFCENLLTPENFFYRIIYKLVVTVELGELFKKYVHYILNILHTHRVLIFTLLYIKYVIDILFFNFKESVAVVFDCSTGTL